MVSAALGRSWKQLLLWRIETDRTLVTVSHIQHSRKPHDSAFWPLGDLLWRSTSLCYKKAEPYCNTSSHNQRSVSLLLSKAVIMSFTTWNLAKEIYQTLSFSWLSIIWLTELENNLSLSSFLSTHETRSTKINKYILLKPKSIFLYTICWGLPIPHIAWLN